MSVTGGSGFDNLDVQAVQHFYVIDAADLPSSPSASDNELEPASSYEAAGGLNRGQTAELVQLSWNGIFGFNNMSTGANQTPGNVDADYEISLSPESQIIFAPGEQITYDGKIIQNNETRNTSPDILYHSTPHQWAPFNDTVNGSGGGGTFHMDHGHMNFRNAFGSGPVLDHNDRIFEHLKLFDHEIETTDIGLYVNLTYFWDVSA